MVCAPDFALRQVGISSSPCCETSAKTTLLQVPRAEQWHVTILAHGVCSATECLYSKLDVDGCEKVQGPVAHCWIYTLLLGRHFGSRPSAEFQTTLSTDRYPYAKR